MAQDWVSPQVATPTELAAAALPPVPQSLRPLSLGELLDRTFSVYRSRFWLFTAISALYAVTALVLQLINLLVRHYVIARHGFQTGTYVTLIGAIVMAAILLVPSAVTQAATVYTLSEVYLGKGTSAAAAFKATIGRWYRYIGIGIWIGITACWPLLLLWVPMFILLLMLPRGGFAWLIGLLFFLGLCTTPYTVWVLLRNLLAVQAAVIEDASVLTAMRRSRTLTRGAKGRIFVVILIVLALGMVAGILQLPVSFLILKSPLQEHNLAQSVSLIVNAFAQVVVVPVGLIGLSLVYFDQRVRQEGFDLLLMLGPQEPPTQPPAVPPVEPSSFVETSGMFAETALDPADPMGDDGRL